MTQTFIYHVLRAISLVVTRLGATDEIHLLFRDGHFKAILRACLCEDHFVRQQAVHLVSELGVNQENDLKQNVLKNGAVKAIVEVSDAYPR
jgi:acetylglutamate synthase